MATSEASHTIIPPSRRPDGSMRKPIRVRAGYVPQDEIAAWESPARRMARLREEAGVPGWEDAPTAPAASSSSASRGIVGGEGVVSSSAAPALSKTQKRNLARKKGREMKRQQQQQKQGVDEDVEEVTSAIAQLKVSGGNGGKAQKRTDRPPQAAGNAAAPAPSSSTGTGGQEEELKKKLKAVQKKLRQVTQLQAKVNAGEITPTQEQLQKLKKKAQFEKEIQELQVAIETFKH